MWRSRTAHTNLGSGCSSAVLVHQHYTTHQRDRAQSTKRNACIETQHSTQSLPQEERWSACMTSCMHKSLPHIKSNSRPSPCATTSGTDSPQALDGPAAASLCEEVVHDALHRRHSDAAAAGNAARQQKVRSKGCFMQAGSHATQASHAVSISTRRP